MFYYFYACWDIRIWVDSKLYQLVRFLGEKTSRDSVRKEGLALVQSRIKRVSRKAILSLSGTYSIALVLSFPVMSKLAKVHLELFFRSRLQIRSNIGFTQWSLV
jgi:hypothetical protein